jgi:hypothetical protein
MSQLINTILVLIIILIIWLVLRLLFRKFVEPNKAFVYSPNTVNGPSTVNDLNKLGYLAAEKKSSGFESVLIDDKRLSDKDVAEVYIEEDQNKIEYRNILLIDNSGSTSPNMDEYKNALKSFISSPFNGEKNAIYTFSDELTQRCDFTDSQTILNDAIDSIKPEGLTALNDSIIAVADLIGAQEMYVKRREDGKSIFFNIILFTDGLDNVSEAKDKEYVIEKLRSRTLFAVCTKEADIMLLNELAKNPKNVFIIGGTNNSQNNLGNTPLKDLNEALKKIRDEKLIGRGTAAYVRMKDEDNEFKTKGFVNVLGEIYSCGNDGEGGSIFLGLCENPSNVESKVFKGASIYSINSKESFNVVSKDDFGIAKNSLPISPTAMTAGAWVVYQENIIPEKRTKPETLINAFPKVAILSLIIWSPIFLLYWILKFTLDFNIFGWLGKELDITITQILLFFIFWTIISTVYIDVLKRKKRFLIFNDAINNVIGTNALSKLIIALSIVGIFLSVFVIFPFSYAAFFTCVLIAFAANLMLSYGGERTWFINQQNPNLIQTFKGNLNGKRVSIKFDYMTTKDESFSENFEIRSIANLNSFESLNSSISDPLSNNIIDYLENGVHITSIYKGFNFLSEAKMLTALGSLSMKSVIPINVVFNSPSQILLKDEISVLDKLIFTLALFKEASHDIIYSNDYNSFAFRTPNKISDSNEFIFDYDSKRYYFFSYDEKLKSFNLSDSSEAKNKSWINI